MTTFLNLRNAVVADLRRSDLTTEVNAAINAAVTDYAATRFWFNDTRTITFSTVAGQEFYGAADLASIPRIVKIDSIVVTDGGTRYPTTRTSNDEIEELADVTANSSRPWLYAYIDSDIRFYPIPNAAYPVRVTGFVRPVALSSDADTNGFTENAFDLIRYSAARRVFASPVRNMEQAGAMGALEREQLARLKDETALRLGSGAVAPMCY